MIDLNSKKEDSFHVIVIVHLYRLVILHWRGKRRPTKERDCDLTLNK